MIVTLLFDSVKLYSVNVQVNRSFHYVGYI